MRGHQAEDITGQRFGKLLVIGRAPNQIYNYHGKELKRAMWFCQCDCGSPVKAVRGQHLRSGRVVSCGCVGYEHAKQAKVKHGQTGTRLYQVWLNMKNRCYNKNVRSFKNYGSRGIKICDEWKNDFGAFSKWAFENGYDQEADYGQCTIDRIDVNGNYDPTNCRLVDLKMQAKNKTTTKRGNNNA